MSHGCDKHSYPTKKDAVTACRALLTRGTRFVSRARGRRHRPDNLRAYHCDLCNGWHITHKKDREGRDDE